MLQIALLSSFRNQSLICIRRKFHRRSVVGIERRWELQVRLRLEEGVAKKDRIQVLQIRVVCIIRIDVEEHREIYFLSWVQNLFLEAETLNFVEIICRLEWSQVVGRNSYNRLVCRILG